MSLDNEPKDLTALEAFIFSLVLIGIILIIAEASKNVPYWQW